MSFLENGVILSNCMGHARIYGCGNPVFGFHVARAGVFLQFTT
jgi:hypothetical protein